MQQSIWMLWISYQAETVRHTLPINAGKHLLTDSGEQLWTYLKLCKKSKIGAQVIWLSNDVKVFSNLYKPEYTLRMKNTLCQDSLLCNLNTA